MLSPVVAVVSAALGVWRHRRERRGLGPGLLLAGALVAMGVGVLTSARGGAGWLAEVSTLVLVVCPVLVGVHVAVLLSAGAMLVHAQGRRAVNLLALAVAFLAAGTTAALLVALGSSDGLWRSVCVVALLWLGYLGLMQVAQLIGWLLYVRTTRPRGVDVIVVLGAGLTASRVTRLLASRLDRALDLAASRAWCPDGAATIVVSGGQGEDEAVTEASAMAEYLVARGIPADRVLLEDRATTTTENLQLSVALMAEHRIGRRIAVVTNSFHVLRSGMTSLRLGLDATVVGSRTALYYLPRAVLRELAAIVASRRWAHAGALAMLGVAGPVLVHAGV